MLNKQDNSDNNLNISSADYDNITINNQHSYIDYLKGGKSREAIGDDFGVVPSEDIKENFKKTLLSNLKGFYNSGYHVGSFIIFSGVPIDYFDQNGPNIHSNNFGYYGKLLFEAFEENVSEMYQVIQEGSGPAFLNYNYLDEYVYYFNILFSPDHPTAFTDNNGTLSIDSSDFKPNSSNLFNAMNLKDKFEIWEIFNNNPYLSNNIGGLIFNELYFTIVHLEKENLELFLSSLDNEEVISFINKVIIIFNFKESNDNNKILIWIYEWLNKVNNKNNQFIKYMGELLFSYAGKGNKAQVSYINKFMSEQQTEAYEINPSGGSIQRVSKDYISFTSFGGNLEGYFRRDRSKLDITGYIPFILKDYLYRGKDVGLKYLKGEIDLAVKNSSKELVKVELLKFFDNEDVVKELIGEGDVLMIVDHIYGSLFRKTNGEINVSIKGEPLFISAEKILQLGEINIWDNQDLSTILEIFHSTELLAIISYYLGIDITNLSLQNQVHLLRFLWEQTTQEFDQFKETLDSIQNEDDKYSFLTTFLACSEDIELGKKIIELASYPGSEKIFEAYSNLVNLQSDVQEDIDLFSFLRVILTRGRGLLEDALKLAIAGEDLRVDNKYEASLVKSGAFVKLLFSSAGKDEIMSMDDLNEKSPDF